MQDKYVLIGIAVLSVLAIWAYARYASRCEKCSSWSTHIEGDESSPYIAYYGVCRSCGHRKRLA